jgi:16S rRNA (guanine527-N7)-methyltransferase
MSAADAEAFQAAFDVSRETMAHLATHLRLLEQWNPRINLVSAASLPGAWARHFADSAQLWRLRPQNARLWLDLGSGAGFPGLVIAALSTAEPDGPEVHLVESDQRKAAFLSVVTRTSNLRATVHAERVDHLAGMAADVVSARALAPLDTLIGMAEKHRGAGGIGLFHKGASVHKEIADAAAHWHFDHVIHPSLTDSRSAIVEIGAARRV